MRGNVTRRTPISTRRLIGISGVVRAEAHVDRHGNTKCVDQVFDPVFSPDRIGKVHVGAGFRTGARTQHSINVRDLRTRWCAR
jgi:hypothetical protein